VKELGIAIVGSGRIGSLRARLAAKHPAVGFIAPLAGETRADFHSGTNEDVIARPEVNAVIVSTPEGEHSAAVRKALELGKPVLVEKPLALTLEDADDMLETVRRTNGDLRIAYSRRYKECFLRAKEQMLHGRLGQVVGATARVYNSRAVAMNILQRDPHATPVLDVLTYYVDLLCWFLEGNPPVEVIARGQRGIFSGAGYDADDLTWAIVTFADGAVVNLGVSYILPADWPAMGQSDRVELLGREGTMIVDDDHLDHLLYTEKGFPAGYLPNHSVNMAFLGANSGGDWALGDYWGSIANETRAWLDSLVTGAPTVHTTPAQARVNLETTLAIVRAAQTRKPVRLPLEVDAGLSPGFHAKNGS
jgi:predicted dehydrogenase